MVRSRSTPPALAFRCRLIQRAADDDQPTHQQSAAELDEDLTAAIINEAHHRTLSRAPLWRILDEAARKPHPSVYWLNSHNPDFDALAQAIGRR